MKAGKTAEIVDTKKEDVACLSLHERHDRQPEGGRSVEPQHRVERLGRSRNLRDEEDDRSLSFLRGRIRSAKPVSCTRSSLATAASIGLCESVNKIIDNLAEVQPTLLFSVPRIFNRLYGVVQKQTLGTPRRRASDGEVRARCRKNNNATAASSRSARASSSASPIAVVFSNVRARFGGRLKFAFSGGAAISRDVAEFIDGIGVMVYEGSGLTETSPISTANWRGSRKSDRSEKRFREFASKSIRHKQAGTTA